MIRREAPVPVVPVIVAFEAGFRIAADPVSPWRPLPRSFVAGLHERSVLVASDGAAHCLQFDLTPLGARRLFRLDLGDLRNRAVDLADSFGTGRRATGRPARERP